jgi:hypothetical protein
MIADEFAKTKPIEVKFSESTDTPAIYLANEGNPHIRSALRKIGQRLNDLRGSLDKASIVVMLTQDEIDAMHDENDFRKLP